MSLLEISYMKNGLSFMPYFITGYGAASIFEICCWIHLFKPMKHLPDILFIISIGFFNLNNNILKWTHLCGIQLYIFFFLIICMIQEDNSRQNIIRWILQSPLFQLYGYISYPLYLLQHTILLNWIPMFLNWINTGYWVWTKNENKHWFQSLSWNIKFVYIFFLTCICYLLQRYLQDRIIASCCAKVYSFRPFLYFSNCCRLSQI